jgi:hypothetical protein
VTVTNERQGEELLRLMITRIGTERAAVDAAFKLDPDDAWLEAIRDAAEGDDDRLRADLIETFKGKPQAAPRVRALLGALDARMADLAARMPVAA